MGEQAGGGAQPDQRLPAARTPQGRHRSARDAGGPRRAAARSRLARTHHPGDGAAVPHRDDARPGRAAAARDPSAPREHLLLEDRRRVHACVAGRGAALHPGANRDDAVRPRVQPGREEGDPLDADGGGGPRALPAHALLGPEAVLAGGRRIADPQPRRDHPARRRGRRAGVRRRHGPPRPAQRAGQCVRQAAQVALRRVRTGAGAAGRHDDRRREVPPGAFGRCVNAGRTGPPRDGLQPHRTSRSSIRSSKAPAGRGRTGAETWTAPRSCRS